MPLDQVDVDKLDDQGDGSEMSFIQHIEALRQHIVRGVIAVLVCGIVAFVAKEFVFDGIIFAPTRDDFPTYRALCWLSQELGLGDSICLEFNKPFSTISTKLSGQFTVHIQVAVVLGIILAFPYIFWEIWRFIRPGLREREIKYTQGIIFFTSLLFFLGVAFGYYILTPFSINFLYTYSISDVVTTIPDVTDYISFLTMMTLLAGIMFELPIAVYFLTKVGFLTPKLMRQYRRHAVVVLLIISAIITPADVSSQVLVFIPILILYELSIIVSARVVSRMDD